jgi:hypothetical protein
MSDQLHALVKATDALASSKGNQKAALAVAGQMLWQSLVANSGTWQPNVLERADSILFRLMEDGDIQTTVETMSPDAVVETCWDIQGLVADVALSNFSRLGEGIAAAAEFGALDTAGEAEVAAAAAAGAIVHAD